ncbi:hypothetical protein Vafri_7216, partial [Volvox africanus]
FVSHGIPNARPGDQVPVVLTVNDGSRGEIARNGISATEAAAEAAATSGHYPGALMVQRDGSGVLADMHISEAIAKYHGWATVGWHIAELDESLSGVYWVEWRVRMPPPLVPAPLSLQPPPALQPRGAMAMAAAIQRSDITEEVAANNEGALLKALQKLAWQQKALEEQLERMQARRVVQHEKQRMDLQQSPSDEQLKGLILLRQQQQQGDFDQEDDPQAQPVSLRQLQSKALESIFMPGLPRQSQQQSELNRIDATHDQAERDARTGPARRVDPSGSGLAGTADDAKHGIGHTGLKEYDPDVRAGLSSKTTPNYIQSRDVLLPITSSTCGGSHPAASKRFVQTRMAETTSLLAHQRSSRPQLLQPEPMKPPKLPPLHQHQRQPPKPQLKVETEARLDSLAGSGNIDELTSSHSPSLNGASTPSSPSAPQSTWPEAIASAPPDLGPAGDRTKRFRASDDGAAAAAEKQATRDSLLIADHVRTKVAPLDANEDATSVPDPRPPRVVAVAGGQSQTSGASGGTPAGPEDDNVVARSAPRLMSRYLTSGEIRVLFTDRDSRVLCNPPCGLLLTIQILLDGQPLGPPQEAQLCRYNGSSPRYLTSVPAQELTSPPIPWKRLAETTIQYRRCRSGLLQLWATRRRGASAAGSGRGPEEGVLQLSAKAAAAMPKLVSFKPAGLRRAAWLAASGSGAGGGDGDGGGIDGDGDSDGGDGITGKADAVEPPLLPASGSLSADAVRGIGPCSLAGRNHSNGAGCTDSDGVWEATQPTQGVFGAPPSSHGRDGGGGNVTIAVHEDAAHATEHHVEGPLNATDGKAELEGNTSGLDPLSGRIGLGNVPNDLNHGMHYNTLPGELRAVGGRGTAAPRSRAEAAAAWGAVDEVTEGAEPQYCTEVLVACRPRSLSRYVTKAELELLVGQEVYEQLCGGNKLADVRVMFEVYGRRLPEIFIADIERYNASSPFYLKAASGRGVDGLPWRSVPPNATVQWRRMADNTLVLAQVSNTTRWDSNGCNTTTSCPNSYQRRGCTGTVSKRRGGAGRRHKRFTEEATESEDGPSDEEYGSGDTENDVQPSRKRRRTRKAAPARQSSQGDDLLEALAGAAGRALMEEKAAELDGAGGVGVNGVEEGEDEDEDEAVGRRRNRIHKTPDLARRSLESTVSPPTAAGEPQVRRNSCGGIDTQHPREAGNGTTAGRDFALLQSVACSGGLGVLTCPSAPTQSQLSAGSQGASSFISRIVATNLYIGRRQLQALYGPGFKADTRSDMQLSLNGTLMPDIYHVQWKEGCHKGSFYPKGAPLGQLRGRFLQGIYWLDEQRNLLVAVAWDQPPSGWPVRRRRMTAAASGLDASIKPRRWLWQRQAERARKASGENDGTAAEGARGTGPEADGGLRRLQSTGGRRSGTGLDAGEEQGGSRTRADSGRPHSGNGGNAPTIIEVLAAAAEQQRMHSSWRNDGDALAAWDPHRSSEAQVAARGDRAHKEDIEGLSAGRSAEEVSLTREPAHPHGGTQRVSCGSSDTSQEGRIGSPRVATAAQHPLPPSSRQRPSQSEYAVDAGGGEAELAAGVDVSVPVPAPAEVTMVPVAVAAATVLGHNKYSDGNAATHIANGKGGGCPKRGRRDLSGRSAVADKDELDTGIVARKDRRLDSDGHCGKCGQPRRERQLSQEGPGDQIPVELGPRGFCTMVDAATGGRSWGKRLSHSGADVFTAAGRNDLGFGVAGTSGEDCSTDDCLEEMPAGGSPPSPPPLGRNGYEKIPGISAMRVLQLVRNGGERGGCARLQAAYQQQQQQYLETQHDGVNASRQDEQDRIQIAAALAPLIAALQSSHPVPLDDDGDAVTIANSNAIIDGSEECAEVTDELVIRTMPWISMHLAQKWYPDAVFSVDHPPYRVQIAIEVDGQLHPESQRHDPDRLAQAEGSDSGAGSPQYPVSNA